MDKTQEIIHKGYCSFQEALKLKEKGFDWKCNAYYYVSNETFQEDDCIQHYNAPYFNVIVVAPTLSQAQKWLREHHNIDVNVILAFGRMGQKYYRVFISDEDRNCYEYSEVTPDWCGYEKYEESLSFGIAKALELI